MDAHFYKSPNLSKEQLQQLIKKSDYPAIPRFISMYSLFLLACVAVVWTWNASWFLFIPAQAFFGVMICSFFACGHETIHNTAFKSLKLNRVASFLIGLGFMYPPTMFRELHFAHHRHTHEPGLDPEISFGGRPIPSVVSNLPSYLSWLSGFPLFIFKVGMVINGALGLPEFVRKNVYPFFDPKVRGSFFVESWAILLVQLSILYVALYINSGFWGYFLGHIVGHSFLASYTAPEHNGLPHEGNILEKTRTIKASKLVKLIMWNMPYHAEHHAYPAVPFHELPKLHQIMEQELTNNQHSHPSFHWSIFKKTTVGE